ncbi:hypothetical protein RIF29_27630 [Crotalaria pallida]|uniref:Uncharacterized protein n=1 Tax=Crotalaria pallida TaxID=3830 RepID=A0AAN9EQ36_CROPI
MTSEVRYGFGRCMKMEVDPQTQIGDDTCYTRKHARFDPAGFNEAIKPSKTEPMLKDDIPELLPKLRPYQRRAAFWMVEWEKGLEESQDERKRIQFHSPLCVPMDFLETSALSVHQLEALDRWEQHARCAYEIFEKDGNRAIVIEELASLAKTQRRYYAEIAHNISTRKRKEIVERATQLDVMEIQLGDPNNLRALEIMGLLREMAHMVCKFVMVVAMAGCNLNKPNNSNLLWFGIITKKESVRTQLGSTLKSFDEAKQ